MILEINNTQSEISTIVLDSIFGKLEGAHRIRRVENKKDVLRPTVAFLNDVSKTLRQHGIEPTIAIAWQVWKATSEFLDNLRTESQPYAELAYWYSIDPFTLTDEQQASLLANLEVMKCQDRIYRGDYSPTDIKGVYQLYLTAFGDEELARKKQTEAARAYVEAKTKGR